MTTENREIMEARGAGESCPTVPKIVPDDPMSEGKSRAALEAECPKPDSSYNNLEETATREDRGCSGSPKLLSPKAGPTTKGQAGDGPELAERLLAPGTPGTPGTERVAEMELEKARMEFELTRLKYLHQENERQRQHEEVMEQLQQQAAPRLALRPSLRGEEDDPPEVTSRKAREQDRSPALPAAHALALPAPLSSFPHSSREASRTSCTPRTSLPCSCTASSLYT
uniref:Transmembrane protein 247 n=1 Tax=Molossus molossus TaxID=27622 RepID=A0A7J8E2C5_MOLMO|nr:hypothetical protein HJG59_009019 [Molossus molossus]